MVLTRWSNNEGIPVTPLQANIYAGNFEIPVVEGNFDLLVWSLIDADLGAILGAKENFSAVQIYWNLVVSLSTATIGNKSAFDGNPIRRKLGNATFIQGIYPISFAQINYPQAIMPKQSFIFFEGAPEPSLSPVSIPDVPTSRDYIISPSSQISVFTPVFDQNFGATRVGIQINEGLFGTARIEYIGFEFGRLSYLAGNSILVSQL